ncbi:hypothetical protein RF11_01702 [Thelohanellus kitauei]|uniref:Uncharacterized protein n=1 Tax=Thelohanellus kitauei TaxID=669202 RepID=A0A0C2J3S6_THEKT|nr:hypothetical protein RF11_01702 [Thelohanellus kitauei]
MKFCSDGNRLILEMKNHENDSWMQFICNVMDSECELEIFGCKVSSFEKYDNYEAHTINLDQTFKFYKNTKYQISDIDKIICLKQSDYQYLEMDLIMLEITFENYLQTHSTVCVKNSCNSVDTDHLEYPYDKNGSQKPKECTFIVDCFEKRRLEEIKVIKFVNDVSDTKNRSSEVVKIIVECTTRYMVQNLTSDSKEIDYKIKKESTKFNHTPKTPDRKYWTWQCSLVYCISILALILFYTRIIFRWRCHK